MDVEYKDKKAQIERSNTLEKLHLSAGKMAKGLEATIANCRNNTLDDHNNELKNKLIVTQDVLDETLKENGELAKEKEDLVEQIQAKDRQIQTQDKQIQELLNRDKKREAEHQLLTQQISDVQKMLAAMMSQSSVFNQPNTDIPSPSSSLSDSDIEVINMLGRKYS